MCGRIGNDGAYQSVIGEDVPDVGLRFGRHTGMRGKIENDGRREYDRGERRMERRHEGNYLERDEKRKSILVYSIGSNVKHGAHGKNDANDTDNGYGLDDLDAFAGKTHSEQDQVEPHQQHTRVRKIYGPVDKIVRNRFSGLQQAQCKEAGPYKRNKPFAYGCRILFFQLF